jgi:dTDP-4-dehydrorhamnose 3,5-epimerase
MIFRNAGIRGAWVIEPERLEDERGFFARTWDLEEFAKRGLNPRLAQCSISYNRVRGTLRGLHYQAAPYEEAKLVRCTAGAIFDVVVDLRPESPSFRDWFGIELSADNRLALYVPEGCAHGFLTLEDDSEVHYQISQSYVPEAGRGLRWNDPAFAITWPGEVVVINERDSSYPDFRLEPAGQA